MVTSDTIVQNAAMFHNKSASVNKHPTRHYRGRKPPVQPGCKNITVDITLEQFQRYLELLKLTNSQFRLRAPEVDGESDDSGLEEEISGDERDHTALTAGSSQHSLSKSRVGVTSTQRRNTGSGTTKSTRGRNAGNPPRAGASQIADRGCVAERKYSKTLGVNKDAKVVDSSRRTRKQNPAERNDKTPQPNTETSDSVSRKTSHVRGKDGGTNGYQAQRVDAGAKIQLTRWDSANNSTYNIEGNVSVRHREGAFPVTRRPTGFGAFLPPLSRDATRTSRRDTQDTGMLLTTSNCFRNRRTNVRFSDATSVSMLSNARCRRPSRWVAGNASSRLSSSTGSGPFSVADATTGSRRVRQSVNNYPKSESKRWLFTTQPTPLRLYVSYYDPPAVKYVDGITADDGTPLLPVSRQHILRGMVYNRHTKSIHPPQPSSMKRGVNLLRNVGRSAREDRAITSTKNFARLVPNERARFKRMSSSLTAWNRLK